jgi:hypothetical protein
MGEDRRLRDRRQKTEEKKGERCDGALALAGES